MGIYALECADVAAVVYRVEDKEGKGPYRNGLSTSYDLNGSHPSPEDDGIGSLWALSVSERERRYFGFRTITECLAWFGHECEHLHNAGFYIAVYVSAKIVSHGRKQIAFYRDEAHRAMRLSCLNFETEITQ